MSIKHFLVLLAATLIIQPVFADEDMSSDDKPCAAIVKACLDGGFMGHGAQSEGKQFWKDCMHPLLLGKTVAGANVDPKDVKACRTAKINQLEREVNALKRVRS
jgi:hypothetical protein